MRIPRILLVTLAGLLSAIVASDFATATVRGDGLSDYEIGYSEFRTNLPGGRHPNVATSRACLVRADGADRRVLALGLIRDENTWTQFAGWSPDGRTAIIGNGYNSPENAAWEEEHHTFRMTQDWRYDMYMLDLATGKLTNVSEPERMSNYNAGLSFWPGNPKKLLGGALIDGNNHPVSMDLDGRNKRDLTRGSDKFTYGASVSPDGKRIAYHANYQVHVADADGSGARLVDTGNPFNFAPQWSPDGKWLMFLSGEHYNCHPYVARPDGTGVRKVGDRLGWRGAVSLFDVHDFHDGSSDVPVWSPDGKWIYFTAQKGPSVELMRVTPDGETTQQLTHSDAPTLHYHPTLSPGGQWVLFGFHRDDARQLGVMPAAGGPITPITHAKPGSAAAHGHWSPKPRGRE
jgi:TolB protein